VNRPPPRSLLAIAIERENWELAALCLIAGFLEVLEALPPDAAESLMEVLVAEDAPRGRRRGRYRERRR
jgi:hypothetical protein